MPEENLQEQFRRIPAVDQLLLRPAVAEWIGRTSHGFVVAEVQAILQGLRESLRRGVAVGLEPAELEHLIRKRLEDRLKPSLRGVVNATGVILHTNLGRAPLSEAARAALAEVSTHYTNLEYDLGTGVRSQRDRTVESLLQELLGCEAAVVVNNNAAAVFLILNSLAAGKEVVVSRGELIEIGGSFRIPDIMTRSGALLREVGTTNKTRLSDVEEAIGPATGLLMRIHPSNYRIRGFTERPGLEELAGLARRHGIPLVEDIGSGCLIDLAPYGIRGEPIARESLQSGADLICFSGDKLMGGPQAGIIAGARRLVEPIRRNPLMRAFRVEKLIYGALEATLRSYLTGRALDEIPVLRMLAAGPEEVGRRARRFLRRLRRRVGQDVRIEAARGDSVIGGGSCPDSSISTLVVAIDSTGVSPQTLENRLRGSNPPVIVRVDGNRTLVDLRTVSPDQEALLLDAISSALEQDR